MKKAIFTLLCLLLAVPCYAAVITVDDDGPADFNNIQAAIDSVNSGDTILVQPGTYVENISFNGKNISVISSDPNDPSIVASTVIDGGGSGSTVTFNGSENSSCALIGFTVTGGGGTSYGGGIKGNGCLATISKCVITENHVSANGGGVDNCDGTISECSIVDNRAKFNGGGLFHCDGQIIDCNIAGNVAQNYSGGGLYGCNGEIIACTITNNSASDEGGGCCRCDGSIRDCLIQGNAASSGAGVFCYLHGTANITDCSIVDNIASGYGGGIYGSHESITIKNCLISGNSARDGGGIRLRFLAWPKIINCVVAYNTASRYGGGISCYQRLYQSSTASIINSTISNNFAGNSGGGVHCDSDRYMRISNSIIWENFAAHGAQVTAANSGLTLTINYSDIQDGYEGIEQKPGCTINWGDGNLDLDPEFTDANNGDFHLWPGSYCIDAGTNSPPGGLEPTDIEGHSRPVDGDNDGESVADMGAYETLLSADPVIRPDQWKVEFSAYEGKANPQNKILGIRNSGSGTVSWIITESCGWLSVSPTSGSSTGEVDDVVLSVDISGLAKGTYGCELTISDPCAINNPRIVTVELVILGPVIALSDSEIEFVYYEGDGGPDIQVLGITNSGGATLHWNITYDCNWLVADPCSGSSSGETDNVELFANALGLGRGSYDCQLVVSDPNAENDPETVLVRLIVAAKLYVPFDYGTIQDAIDAAQDNDVVIIQHGIYQGNGNRDLDFGGKAITLRSTDPNDPNIVAATIIDCNGTEADPHRAFYFNSGEDGNSVVAGFTIKNGYADDGAGVYCIDSSPVITNCNFINGSAENWGGGICCYKSSPLISDCTFTGNSAFEGGAITTRSYWNYLCSPHIENCRIFGNTASGSGGGINSDCLSTPTISSCTISGNFAGTYGGGGISIFQSNPTIINCLITHNSSGNSGGGILHWYEFENGSTITNCTIASNSADEAGGIFCSSEMTVTNSILWDNSHQQIMDQGTVSVIYSNVQGDWLGIGNLDNDPCFVDTDNNDFHLLEDSLCINVGDPDYIPGPNETDLDGRPRILLGRIDMGAYEFNHIPIADAGPNQTTYAWLDGIADVNLDGSGSYDDDGDELTYLWTWTIEPNTYETNGVTPTIELPVGEHTIELIVNDGADDSEPNYVTITVVPPVQVDMKVTPQVLNLDSHGKWVKAHFVMPDGFSAEQIDTSTPAVFEPPGIESDLINVFVNEEGLVEIKIAFDRSSFCAAPMDYGSVEVSVIGSLITGRYFYGTDIIRIKTHDPRCIAFLASYWLDADCGAPDWCGAFDLDHNSKVDFADYSIFADYWLD